MTKAAYCLIIGSILSFSTAHSQNSHQADSSLATVKSLYDSGSYISAELQARRMLEDNQINDSAKVQFEKYVAFSLIAQGKNESAIEHFTNILRIDTSFSLDQVLTSPKILAVFQQAKEQWTEQLRKDSSSINGPPGAGPSPADRLASGPTFRTLLFPGWDQIYRGKREKGNILLGAGAVTAVSSIAADLLRRQARSNYLSAGTPSLATSKYKTYNFYYKAEVYSVSAFILFYLYSEIDSYVNLPPNFKADFNPQSSGGSVGLTFTF